MVSHNKKACISPVLFLCFWVFKRSKIVKTNKPLHKYGVRHTGYARGFMVETAEAMISNTLRAEDLPVDSLEELEDTVGIRIIHRGGSGGPDSGRHLSSSWVASGSSGGDTSSCATGENDENLRIINRGPIGSIPAVNQL